MKTGTRAALTVLLAAVMAAVSLSICGCGSGKADLSYDNSATNAVIIFRETQAIAPIYNLSVPKTIIYGDEKVIRKENSYDLIQGKVGSGGLEMILGDLEGDGFFDLKETYSGEMRAGGITQILTVNLIDRKYEVTVEKGSEPEGWTGIVNTVTAVDITGEKEYVPEEVILYAKEESGPDGREVMAWPGDPEDLAKAAAGEGVKLEGDDVKVVWKAVQDTYEKVDDIVWQGGDKYYSYVYASPVFPGVEQ